MTRFLLSLLFLLLPVFTSQAQTVNSIGLEMVPIPAGSFYMGSEGLAENRDEAPIHRVHITQPFKMSATEVTNAQYELFDPSHKTVRGKYGLSKGDREAVLFVSYPDAEAFCHWLTEKEGKSYRLPTEAEWEYACRAGTLWHYSMDDGLPAAWHKQQHHVWGYDPKVDLTVGQTPPNPWGLYDMHGNVEEWCLDWYGPYTAEEQYDPVGRVEGDFRVTRGGSHSTPVAYLRSANRMALIPGDRNALTGFRVVEGPPPTTAPLVVAEKPAVMRGVSQQVYTWPSPETKPFFREPLVYIHRPDPADDATFYDHNHCPAVTGCDNGDLLAIWFSTNNEEGREMTILGSRLRQGNETWDAPSEFFKVPDRNMTGSSLYRDTDGQLIHVNGVEVAGSWQKLAMAMRTSDDNGATWSKPTLIAPEHDMRHQVIAGMFRTREGWLVQPADAVPHGNGGTALHISKDGGLTWEDPGLGIPNDFRVGGQGGSIAGIHAGVVQLLDGSFLALGRGDNLPNEQGLLRMPMSRSTDGGRTWQYSASEFPPIDGGQRLVLCRLDEGPLLLISFTHHPYRLKDGLEGMDFGGKKGYGMYAALSFDEGKTWPIQKLLTDSIYRFMNGGAWTGYFEMDSTHAEPRGYLAATQTPDGTIHLLSSRNHYRLNLAWLLDGQQYPLTGQPFTRVRVTDPFWKERLETNAELTIRDVLAKCEEYGRVQNFAVAAGKQPGGFKGGSSWDDSDLFKALEGASHVYAATGDESLRRYMDSVITFVAEAQEPEGYLVTVMRINGERNLPWNIRSPRFSYMIWSHELYNFGHLYEAAAAHYRATGQNNLLEVATRKWRSGW